jgi:N utilization substance protein A
MEVDVDVIINSQGKMELYLMKNVVEEVEEEICELTVEEAEEFTENPQIGDVVKVPLKIEQLGWNAARAASQVLKHKIKQAEKKVIYSEYKDQVGNLVTGLVQQVDRKGVHLLIGNSGRTEALLPPTEQIPGERYKKGEKIMGYIYEVLEDSKTPQVRLSRTVPEFLAKLLELEVQEIFDGYVEIKKVVREPGVRAKVAVSSRVDYIDPMGACVGPKGSRVKQVTKELNGERIDVIVWSDDPIIYVTRALTPAVVENIIVDEDERTMTVVVPQEARAIAIGKSGQNARLASRLVGWRLQVMGDKEYREQFDEVNKNLVLLEEVEEFGEKTVKRLEDLGYFTVQDLIDVSRDYLEKINGIGKKTAAKIIAIRDQVLAELEGEEIEYDEDLEAEDDF